MEVLWRITVPPEESAREVDNTFIKGDGIVLNCCKKGNTI